MGKRNIKAGEVERVFDERIQRHYWINTLVPGRKFSNKGKAKMAYREQVALADKVHWDVLIEEVLEAYERMGKCPKCGRPLELPVANHIDECAGFKFLVYKKTRENWERLYAESGDEGIE